MNNIRIQSFSRWSSALLTYPRKNAPLSGTREYCEELSPSPAFVYLYTYFTHDLSLSLFNFLFLLSFSKCVVFSYFVTAYLK